MKGIRLSDHQVLAIKQSFKECFTDQDHLWLFGSRTELSKRGGDIDLYIETIMSTPSAITKAKFNFITKLNIKLGEQKIDIVIKDNTELLIYKIAREKGIQLI